MDDTGSSILETWPLDYDDPRSSPLPPSAVLYNFEHVPSDPEDIGQSQGDGGRKNRRGTFVGSSVLAIYQRFALWDFSASNVDALKNLGLTHAQHVPLGYAREGFVLEVPPRADEPTDVLFYGSYINIFCCCCCFMLQLPKGVPVWREGTLYF